MLIMFAACKLVSDGVLLLYSPLPSIDRSFETLASSLRIPFLTSSEVGCRRSGRGQSPLSYHYTLNLRPRLSVAMRDLITLFACTNITYIYDNSEGRRNITYTYYNSEGRPNITYTYHNSEGKRNIIYTYGNSEDRRNITYIYDNSEVRRNITYTCDNSEKVGEI